MGLPEWGVRSSGLGQERPGGGRQAGMVIQCYPEGNGKFKKNIDERQKDILGRDKMALMAIRDYCPQIH